MFILNKINSFVWGNGLIFLLLFTGVIYTIRLKFVQFRLFPFLFRRRKSQNKGISQFRTVSMSLGTSMGTGNIVGVASALSVGGAGAVFWMWVSAFLGMALVYAENSLSVTFSDKSAKGAFGYLKNGLHSPFLAAVFAVFCILAALGMGGMVQVNSFAEYFRTCTNRPAHLLAFPVFCLIFAVVSGGAKRIGTAAQLLLPTAAVIYSLACLSIIIRFHDELPDAVRSVFSQAFGIRQAVGGVSGIAVSAAVSTGIRRGIFSNEAGLGSSPILHSAAESDEPHIQGMWAVFEVFADTMLCCTLTALTLLVSTDDFSVIGCFSSVFGGYSDIFVTAEMAVFAFCTVIGWYYCGECAFRYLTKSENTWAFSAVFALIASSGTFLSSDAVWTLSDIFNGLMAFPNLLALLYLKKYVVLNKSSVNRQ